MEEREALDWVGGVFEETAGRIRPSTLREEIPGWDSLGTLSLIAAFDEAFDIQLSEKDIDGLKGVNDIFDILRRHGVLQSSIELRRD